MAKDELINKFNYIGTRPNRPDGLDKVTGRAKYGADFNAPNMLHAPRVSSDPAHPMTSSRKRNSDLSDSDRLGVAVCI